MHSAEAPARLAPPDGGARVWVEVGAPSPDEVRALCAGFGLHELNLQDALQPGHPPKLEAFGEHLFLIAHTPTLSGRDTRKVALFLGRDWLVTVTRLPLPLLDEVRARVLREPGRNFTDPDFVVFQVLYALNERFETLTDAYQKRVEALEHRATFDCTPQMMQAILELSREVSHFSRLLRYQREVCQALAHQPHPVLGKQVQPYLRDAYEQILHIADQLETVRDGIGAARVVALAAVNNRVGDVMRTLTVIATVMMPLTLITSLFGMNFAHIPGLDSAVGFWIVLAALALLGLGLWLWFRRRHWL